MDLFRRCQLEPPEEGSQPSEVFELLPCQRKFRLRTEDVISLDSIFSDILSQIEPTEAQLPGLKFNVNAKDLLNEKQAMLFDEQLFISKLKNTNCKLFEESKIFLERELQPVGNFSLKIEESYDGYVILSKSEMKKELTHFKCGHSLKGKYDNKFLLIVEKRTEYDYVDDVKVEKSLEVRNKEDEQLVAIRKTKFNNSSQSFKAVINIKGREDIFILDGGVLLFMRYLIVNNFFGEYKYFTMNLFGKVLNCTLTVQRDRKKVRVFKRTYTDVIRIVNTQYFNNKTEEISETFYTANGRMVLHYWHNYNYLLHSSPPPHKHVEQILPKLELMWRCDKELLRKYTLRKKLTYENAMKYLTERPELADFLHDYIAAVLNIKPHNVLEFTVQFFQNMKKRF